MLHDEITKEEQSMLLKLPSSIMTMTRKEHAALCAMYFSSGCLFSCGVWLLLYVRG